MKGVKVLQYIFGCHIVKYDFFFFFFFLIMEYDRIVN